MGTALTGLEIKDTYQGLIKTTDNGALTSLKALSDGLGNDSALALSTSVTAIRGGQQLRLFRTDNAIYGSIQYLTGAGGFKFDDANGDGFTFAQGADTRLFINATGNVGIGTSAPNYSLQVNSSTTTTRLQITNSTTGTGAANGLQIIQDGSNATLSLKPSGFMSFETTNAERVRIDSSGNVGIGNSNPNATLDVTGTLAVSGNATFDTNTLFVDATNNRVGIGTATPTAGMLNVVGPGAANGLTIKSAGNGGTFPLRVTYTSGTDGDMLCVNDSGFLGINTTAPTAFLDVVGTSFLRGNVNAGKTANINVTTAVNGVGGGNREFDTFTGASATGFTGTDSADQGHGYFAATIVAGRSYEVSATMVVTNGSPLSFITTTGLNFATQTVQNVQGSPLSGTTYRFVASGNASFFGISASNTGGGMTCVVSNFSLKEVGSVLVTSDSNVGIGTTSPDTALDVNGGSKFRGSISGFTGAEILLNGGSNSQVALSTNGTGSTEMYFDHRGTATGIWKFRDTTDVRMSIIAGNVGIGTSSPTELLHLSTTPAGSTGVGTAIQITSAGAGGDQAFIGVNKGTGNGLELSVENRDIIFNTGATTPFGGTERFRITANGVTFNGDTAAANALDDYEEGAWSPQVYYQNATDQANATNVTQVGSYTKIGRLVTITCVLQWTITGSPAADNIGVKNLPFTSTSGADLIWFGACQMVNAGGYPTDGYKIYMNQNSSLVLLYDDRSDAGNYGLDVGASGTKTLRFSFTYSAS